MCNVARVRKQRRYDWAWSCMFKISVMMWSLTFHLVGNVAYEFSVTLWGTSHVNVSGIACPPWNIKFHTTHYHFGRCYDIWVVTEVYKRRWHVDFTIQWCFVTINVGTWILLQNYTNIYCPYSVLPYSSNS